MSPESKDSVVEKMHSAPAAFVAQVHSDRAIASYTDGRGCTLLHHAYPYPEVVRALLDAGANPNAVDVNGSTPVHVATKWAAIDSLRHLLSAGGDATLPDAKGITAMDLATTSGRQDVLRLLRREEEPEFVFAPAPVPTRRVQVPALGLGCSLALVFAVLASALLGFIVLKAAIRYRTELRDLAARGVTTQGEVVSRDLDEPGYGKRLPRYAAGVRYRAGGREHLRHTSASFTERQGPAIGSRVDVLYLPDDPTVARLPDHDLDDWGEWKIGALIGSVMIVAPLALLVMGLRRRLLFMPNSRSRVGGDGGV